MVKSNPSGQKCFGRKQKSGEAYEYESCLLPDLPHVHHSDYTMVYLFASLSDKK